MLAQIFLTTVFLPLIFGMVVSVMGKGGTTRAIILTALLIPVAAAIANVMIEGIPPFPPIAAKQKLPVLLVAGGLFASVLAMVLRPFFNRWLALIVSVVSLAIPAWWLGRNVIAANPAKATTLAVVLVILAAGMIAIARPSARRAASAPLPAALLATAIGTALAAVTGGYIGMAQMNGAIAALFGGWLLVRYVAYLRGDADAFSLSGFGALSFTWTAAIGVAMTVLFTPNASPAALVLSALPIIAFLFLSRLGAGLAGLPRAIQPVLFGLISGLPAIVGIVVAFL
jgi:hypothetical protein